MSNLNVTLDADVAEKVRVVAKREDRTVKQQVNRLLREAFADLDVAPSTTQEPDHPGF